MRAPKWALRKQRGYVGMHMGDARNRTVNLTIAADTADYVIFTAASSPADPVDVILTINAGVTVRATSASNAAIRSSTGWAAGSTLRIVNNGDIKGFGGDGGAGGNGQSGGAAGGGINGSNGSAGGDAIDVRLPTIIDNTSGNIYGGGGGAGGGAGDYSSNGVAVTSGGGGGGGGQGRGLTNTTTTGAGGAGGTRGNGTVANNGSSGGGGSDLNGPGIAGNAGSGSTGNGGLGGAWGSVGANGSLAADATGTVGTGGAGGFAVRKNGNTVTFSAGNNGSQVKGSVGVIRLDSDVRKLEAVLSGAVATSQPVAA
jgi:hypothetical protein